MLIILLMIAPLRAVNAMQTTACDMDDTNAVAGKVMIMSDIHASHDMSAMSSDKSDSETMQHKCCCCDSDCANACDMNVSSTLLIQVSSYLPVFTKTSNVAVFSPEILSRALPPPSRPPLKLS